MPDAPLEVRACVSCFCITVVFAEAACRALFVDGLQAKAREGGDCCDTAGQGVLSSEVEGWKSSYLNALVLNGPSSEAQEARARVLQKTGGDGEQQKSNRVVDRGLLDRLTGGSAIFIDDLESIQGGILK